MKALLYKDFKLCLHPTIFIYLAMVLMLLIPSYMYLVPCFFLCNAIFFIFQQARENGDPMYTAVLPVSKAQTVKARTLFVVIFEILDFLLLAGMCAFSLVAVNGSNAAGTDHSLSLLAFSLVVFAVFNLVFLPGFYKTGYKAGAAFVKATVAVWLVIFAIEGLMIAARIVTDSGLDVGFFRFLSNYVDCFPASAKAWTVQAILFGAGLLVYVVGTLLAVRMSVKRYEQVDVQ